MSSSPLWDGVREGCGSCEFVLEMDWVNNFALDKPKEHRRFVCRRYPPTTTKMTSGGRHPEQMQPVMYEDSWCGEYRRSGT